MNRGITGERLSAAADNAGLSSSRRSKRNHTNTGDAFTKWVLQIQADLIY